MVLPSNKALPLLWDSSLKGNCKRAEEGLFRRACSGRTRGDGFRLKEGCFRLDIREKLFTVRVLRH